MSSPAPRGPLDRARAALRISKLSHALVALLAALITAGVVVEVTPDHHVIVHVGKTAAPATATKVDGSAAPGIQPQTVTTSSTAARQVAASPELGLDLRGEAPAGVTDGQASHSLQAQEKLAHDDQLPIVQPDAAPAQRGCVSHFVRNYSTRRGVAPRIITLHYTVSANRPGWDDVNAVVNLFNTASDQASSNYVIDADGNCAYIVRESDKAWTQAGGNPYSISFEVIDTGHETHYMNPAGYRKLALVIGDISKRWHIPIRRGAVSNCVPTRSGIIQHKDWGLCGGGHFDITPFSIDSTIAVIRHDIALSACSARCHTVKRLRGKHLDTHRRLRKNHCAHGRKDGSGKPRIGGYCDVLRKRNAYVHKTAKAKHISLAGTYR